MHCKKIIKIAKTLLQCVSSDEIGKTFSLVAVAGAGIPLASSPILRWLYHQTFLTTPGDQLL